MPTVTRPEKKLRKAQKKSKARHGRRSASFPFVEEMPLSLSRSLSLDTLATPIPRRIRLVPKSGSRSNAAVEVDLPEGTVLRLLLLNEQSDVVDTLVDGWLPAGAHELCDLCLPNGSYKLRLETPNAWHVAGIMIG